MILIGNGGIYQQNPNITWDIIVANHDIKYTKPRTRLYTLYPDSTHLDFLNMIDITWNWNGISKNPNITWEIIQNNPDKDWNWEEYII